MKPTAVSAYANSWIKRGLDLAGGGVILALGWPIFLGISLFIWIAGGWPILFTQKRVGFRGKRFTIYKFRTMYLGAEAEQERYRNLNEADGPVFKISNDPRYRWWGKWLAWSGLDELPQLYNVFWGQMSLVGPRPLPENEWKGLAKTDRERNLVKPGITSLWVVKGAHQLTFEEWMRLDRSYISQARLELDLKILVKTMAIPFRVWLDRGLRWHKKTVGAVYENK